MHMRDQGFLGTKLGCFSRKGEMLISPPTLVSGPWHLLSTQGSPREEGHVCAGVWVQAQGTWPWTGMCLTPFHFLKAPLY